ncbi:MAG: hypothetical protein JWN70_6373 [Planctomycetaceae bacterium]|nr:hypothetical protein [Planctomycetaceae bacterium]
MSDRLRILQDTGEEVLPLPRVVLLGAAGSSEFSEVQRMLSVAVPEGALTQLRNVAELAELYRQGEFPDLIIFVQTWSDEFPFRDVLALPGFGPLSRVLCCYGPWCVSDGRSRQDWPLALRVPLEHFGAALRAEMQQLTAPNRAEAPLPWTAGRDEIFGRRQQPISAGSASGSRCVIRVISPDRKLAEMWVELVRKAGFPVAAEGSAGGGQVVLWDADPFDQAMRERWSEFRRRFPSSKMVALVGFVTADIVSELRDLVAASVISKLLPLDLLLAELRALAPGPFA